MTPIYTSLDNIITGLERSDRIRQIDLDFLNYHTTSKIEKLWTAMQVPFPELERLYLSFGHTSYGPVLLDSFLGGSAPRLRYLCLDGIPFPGLPKLLLSASHLVHLYLHHIPHSEYISPEAMAACLSSTSLERLLLEIDSQYPPQSFPNLKRQRPFPPTRSVLPTLTNFSFKGVNEYLEEFVARIDAPTLYRLSTTFFDGIDFNTSESELNKFISRTSTLGAYEGALLIFGSNRAQVRLHPFPPERSDHSRMVEVEILSWEESDWQLSTLAQICALSLRLLLTMENLFIDGTSTSPLVWEDYSTKWVDLLLPFTAVKNLYLSQPILPRIARALQELTGARTTEVLPALQNVFLERFQPSEPVHEGIAQFISARQLTNHPVVISVWDRDLVQDQW
jgi:hypothetical protein